MALVLIECFSKRKNTQIVASIRHVRGTHVFVFLYSSYRKIVILSLAGTSLAADLSIGLLVVNLNGMAGGKLDHFIARPALSPPVFTTERAYALADILVAEGKEFMDDALDVLYCDNTPLSVTWIVVGLAIYLLGKFSILPILMVVTVAAFTLPIGYEKNKPGHGGGVNCRVLDGGECEVSWIPSEEIYQLGGTSWLAGATRQCLHGQWWVKCSDGSSGFHLGQVDST
jgi:Reticulon